MLLDTLTIPIVQAPMAGGLSTPALAVAVSEAGGLGFLAAGLIAPEALAADLAEVRRQTTAPFGVNLFFPSPSPGDPAEIATYAERIRPLAEGLGVELGPAEFGDDHYEEKLALLAADPPAVVSFVFGCPPLAVVERLQAAGAEVWITVTQLDEADVAVAAGADAVVAQGSEAGGHRGSFVDDDREPIPLLELIAEVEALHPDLPVVAAGGLMAVTHIRQALRVGASAAQLGTAFMLTPEAGTHPAHRALLGTKAPTALTRAFSGRRARGIVNAWMNEVGEDAPSAYPELVHLTAPVRQAAMAAGDAGHFNLWAGERHVQARAVPAAALVGELGAALGRHHH